MSDRSFWEKLTRRHVIKVGIAYIVIGTAVGGVADVFLPNLGAPGWVLPTILGVLVLGLPVALVLAWAYELTPEGIVREESNVERWSAGPAQESAAAAPVAIAVADERKSIVVLPFDNMSPDPNDAYFSDGLTEEIITQLSHLRSLRVISRNSSMVLKNTEMDTRTIGRELGVQYVMEGSVRKAGDSLRITAQLIDAGSDEHLWAETYSRELEDIFEIQSEIALSVAEALRASLDPQSVEKIKSAPTESLDAHEAYLLGRHHFWAMTGPDVFWRARGYFEQALDQDPGYASPQAALAWWYLWAAPNFSLLSAAEAIPNAKAEAQRAIELDPDAGDAYAALALVEGWYYWHWKRAQESAKLGVERDPNSYFAWFAYANVFGPVGEFQEAIAGADKLLELDPLHWVTYVQLGWHYGTAGRIDEAMRYSIRCDELHPYWGAWQVAYHLQALGQDEEALERLERVREYWGELRGSIGAAVLAYALGRAGRKAEFDESIADLQRRVESGVACWSEIAWAYMGVRDHEMALQYLEKAPDQVPPGNHITAWVATLKHFDPIRDRPRFQAVLKRLGLE